MSHLSLSFDSGEDSLDPRRFDVRETISKCFNVKLVAMSPNDDLDLDALVGRPARFTMRGQNGGVSRVFRCVCLGAEQAQAEDKGLSTYEIELGPKLALLAYRSRYRIFQQQSIPDIVLSVLREWGLGTKVDFDVKLHPVLECRVQLGETDLSFVSRLLEEAGIAFSFPTDEDAESHDGPTPDIRLTDASSALESIGAVTHLDGAPAGSDARLVTRVRVGRKLRAGRVVIRDQHFRLRHDTNLAGVALMGNAPNERLERYDYIQGRSVASQDVAGVTDTPVADLGGALRPQSKVLENAAVQSLNREQSRRREVSFETNVLELRPGLAFRIEGHPRAELRTKELFVTELRSTGTTTGAWKLEGRALFTDIPFTPLLETPKPRASGVQTATVVGPKSEDVHTDELGRVRVQFAWDRENAFDEKSSCWLRVSQGWAGGGHASFALPRVGDEVLVGFFDADPDQPVVIGRLHNSGSPVPYRLPESKTVSTWRSASIPATGGFNELKFDDAAGRELVSVQAEHDMTTLVKNIDSTTVGASRIADIAQTDDVSVGQRHSITIGDKTSPNGATRIETTPSKIILTTGEARLILEGPNITFEAPGAFIVKAAQHIRVESATGDVVIQGGPFVRINPRGAGENPDAPGGAIPFDLQDGESPDAFTDYVADITTHAWFDPKAPNYLEDATSTGGELDPTPRGQSDDELRAFKYAVAGRTLGMPEGVLVRRSGALNLAANGARAGSGEPGNGVFGGEAPYGNSTTQYAALQKGFSFYDQNYAGLSS